MNMAGVLWLCLDPLVPFLVSFQIHPARLCRNPLMLPKTLDEQLRDGELVETSNDPPSPRVGKRRRLYNAAQVED